MVLDLNKAVMQRRLPVVEATRLLLVYSFYAADHRC